MAIDDDPEANGSGEWGVFVARAAQDIRAELGETAASRVSALLHGQKAEAISAAREQLSANQALLEQSLNDTAQARRAHERLQADIARMETALRAAKAESARVRAAANDAAAQRRAEVDSVAEQEATRIAAAWEEVRQQELEVAARRSESLDLDERADQRQRELDVAARQLESLRAEIHAERAQAERVVEDAISKVGEIEAGAANVDDDVDAEASPDPEVDLRDNPIDLRQNTLDEREHELDEWEAELVDQARRLDARADRSIILPTPDASRSGWGRPRSADS